MAARRASSPDARSTLTPLGGDLCSLLHELNLDLQRDILADQQAARLERLVPLQAELAPLDHSPGTRRDCQSPPL